MKRLMLITLMLAGCTVPSDSPMQTPDTTPESGGTARALLTAPPTALFRSGFEKGVSLEPPTRKDGEWLQKITGADSTGDNWSTDLPQRDDPNQQNRFTNLVNDTTSGGRPQSYVETLIDTLPGYDGKPTRALKMMLKKEDTTNSAATRDQFGIYPEFTMKQGYLKYRLRLQPDLPSVLKPGTRGGVIITETKMAGSPRADYRWNLFVQRDPAYPELYWRAQAQYGDQEDDEQVWECTSHVPVPTGDWATMEVFWKLDPSAGRIWIAVNGATIVDYKGRTMKSEPIYVWWPWKIYLGGALPKYAGKTFYQWIDDVELQGDLPHAVPIDAHRSNTCVVR